MRPALRVVVVAATATVSTLAGAAVPAQSAPANGGTKLVGAVVTVDKPTLIGTELGMLTVTIHLTDPDGVTPTSLGLTDVSGVSCPCVSLRMDSSTGIAQPVSTQSIQGMVFGLRRTSGDATDGIWSGSAPVGAASAGRWELSAVGAGTLQTEEYPFSGRTLYPVNGIAMGAYADITGSNWPVIHMNPLPKPVAVGQQWPVSGSVYLSDTKEPAAGVTLALSHRCSADTYNNPRQFVTTDSNGNWHTSFTAPVYDPTGGCAGATAEFGPSEGLDKSDPENAVSAASRFLFYPQKTAYWVASLTAGSSRAPTTLTGVLPPDRYDSPTVYLQRRTSSGWSSVAHVAVAYGHRSFSFRVTRPGTYRVRVSGSEIVAAGYSNSVAVQ